jgi:hypothetical protein
MALLLQTDSLGWQGLHLLLPADCNLSAFGGTAARGWCAVSDLRAVRFAARWHKPRWRTAAQQFQRLAAALRRKAAGGCVQHAQHVLHADLASGERLLLAHDDSRNYELHWPRKPDDGETTLAHFVMHLENQNSCRTAPWLWQAFGIRGHAPAFARLLRASLLPGAPHITLTAGTGAFVMGAFSLADRVLRGTSLKDFAQARLRLGSLPGRWSDDDSGLTFQGTARRRIFARAASFRFVIEHHETANRIRWNLTTRRPFLRIWRP